MKSSSVTNFTIDFTNASSTRYINSVRIKQSVIRTLVGENITDAVVSIVIVDDDVIHSMNKEFLNHDYPTDVITFPLDNHNIDGEIYISVGTARLQAQEYGVTLTNELMRLAIHGVLHLVGYDDALPEQRNIMHEAENTYLIEA